MRDRILGSLIALGIFVMLNATMQIAYIDIHSILWANVILAGILLIGGAILQADLDDKQMELEQREARWNRPTVSAPSLPTQIQTEDRKPIRFDEHGNLL